MTRAAILAVLALALAACSPAPSSPAVRQVCPSIGPDYGQTTGCTNGPAPCLMPAAGEPVPACMRP